MSQLTSSQVIQHYNYLRKLESEVGIHTPDFVSKYTELMEQLKYDYPSIPYEKIFKTDISKMNARSFMYDYIQYRIDTTGMNHKPLKIGYDCWGLILEYLDCKSMFNLATSGTVLMKAIKPTLPRRIDELLKDKSLDDCSKSRVDYYEMKSIPNKVLNLDIPFLPKSLPNTLTHLIFEFRFNEPVDQLCLPSSLTHLKFGDRFNQPVDNLRLPSSLTHLTFGCRCAEFNQPVDNLRLPPSLLHLEFGYNFNQPIDKLILPESLIRLTFGAYFNQCLDNVKFPSSLRLLYLGGYNLPVDNLRFPESLTSLHFGWFNQPVTNLRLPGKLKNLSFLYDYGQSVDDLKLPESLIYLDLGEHPICGVDKFVIPSNLKEIKISNELLVDIQKNNSFIQNHNCKISSRNLGMYRMEYV